MPGTPNIVAIVHGKSEDILVKGLGVRMGLRVMTFSRNGGNENIAMSALPRILSRDPFDSEISLHRRFPMLEYHPRKIPRIPDLGLYPVMDHDGDDRNLRGYISGDLLCGCPLHDRIVPIINRPDLDSVMERIGYGRPRDKVEFYHGLVGHGCDVIGMYERFRECGDTNLDVLMHRLMSSSPGFQNRIEAPTGLFRGRTWFLHVPDFEAMSIAEAD